MKKLKNIEKFSRFDPIVFKGGLSIYCKIFTNAGRSCAEKLKIEFDRIEFCARSEEGRSLHYKAGVMTDKVGPPVSFIPTIEIESSQHNQKTILKAFDKEICRIFTEKYLKPGQKIANCKDA